MSTSRPFARFGSARHRLGRRAVVLAVATALAAGVGAVVFPSGGAAAAARVEPNGVAAYGAARDLGPTDARTAPLAGMAPTRSGDGYWLAASDGGVFAFGDARFHGGAFGRTRAWVTGIAPTRAGHGYWLAAADGGVFAFGDARFHGSAAGMTKLPVTGIAPTPSGHGYWLVASDGGVFGFGDARYHGSASGRGLNARVVGIAASPTGHGYWLLSADGGVFAFGDARFYGSSAGQVGDDAVGIAADTDGRGYRVAVGDGTVRAHGAHFDGPVRPGPDNAPTVGIASRDGGYWTVQAYEKPAPNVDPDEPFLVCTRRYESDTSGGYGAVNPTGTYRGAYQFSRTTWNYAAAHAGRTDLIGVDPALARPADQDFLALHLYRWEGARHWEGRCAGL